MARALSRNRRLREQRRQIEHIVAEAMIEKAIREPELNEIRNEEPGIW